MTSFIHFRRRHSEDSSLSTPNNGLGARRLSRLVLLVWICGSSGIGHLASTQLAAQQTTPSITGDQPVKLQARASQIDPRTGEYPDIDFVFSQGDKPQDQQQAMVDLRVPSQGRLVIWLMGYNQPLFERLSGYGLHVLRVHYANQWFSRLCQPAPRDGLARGLVRLEAATGDDWSDELEIAKPDSMMERSRQFLLWLSQEHPAGGWEQFLSQDRTAVRWDRVTVAGSSHGATTAARFAMYQAVDRVVMLCGPRDQDQDWQGQESATDLRRFFGFSHDLDTGWTGDHYSRSWEMLQLDEFGPIVNVDHSQPPYQHSRRLISSADVKQDAKRAHSAVTPGAASPRDAEGQYLYEPVWHYLWNHPHDQVGTQP